MRPELKAARLAHRLTQQQLADAVGVGRSYISLMEHGTYTPSLRVAQQLASVLHMSVDALFPHPEQVRDANLNAPRS